MSDLTERLIRLRDEMRENVFHHGLSDLDTLAEAVNRLEALESGERVTLYRWRGPGERWKELRGGSPLDPTIQHVEIDTFVRLRNRRSIPDNQGAEDE